MFGYILINKPELKIKEFDRYHAYYCGLCHTLKKYYGNKSRLSLNYDLTFLGLLLSGLYEPDTINKQSRCMLHPLSKHLYYQNKCIDYVAKMSLVLTYQKCKDDVLDEGKHTKKWYQSLLEKHYQKIKQEYPNKIVKIEQELDMIRQLENKKEKNLDIIAGSFGKVMAEICVYQDDEWRNELYQFGFFLGKFIYLMDAYDDLHNDHEKGLYNPFLQNSFSKSFEKEVYQILEMMISNATLIFERLPIITDSSIIRNILYSGVWTKYELVKNRRLEKKEYGSL